MNEFLKAPFPWFGGKSRVAPIVWERFGHVQNYVEPFFGSGAVLLGKPADIDCIETINDKDAYVANFWRAIKHDPDRVAYWTDNPQNENDLHARHIWLVQRKETLRAQIEGDPDYFDSRIAGYWVFGIGLWIGGEFCSGKGPWKIDEKKRLFRISDSSHNTNGIQRRIIKCRADIQGEGIHQKRIAAHADAFGTGIFGRYINIKEWFYSLSKRLSKVRICSGEWTRLMGPTTIHKGILTGLFFDPPYTSKANRSKVYNVDSDKIGNDVFDWAIEHDDLPFLRIAICGYEGEYDFPSSWTKYEWKSISGISGGNRFRERIWFSPHCLKGQQQLSLFG